MTNEQKMLLISLRKDGLGYKRIADRIGISENTVKSFCRRNAGVVIIQESKEDSCCKCCGKLIEQNPKRKEKKFCSDACRMKWWNSHLDQVERKAIYEYTCPACGRKFSVYGDAKRKYCSHKCYVAHRFGGGDGE